MRRPITVLIGFLFLGLAACSDYTKDIEAVRQDRTVSKDQTNDELARQLAGARGKVEWVADRPEKYKDNEYIVGVTAKIERITRAGGKRLIELQFHPQPAEPADLLRAADDRRPAPGTRRRCAQSAADAAGVTCRVFATC